MAITDWPAEERPREKLLSRCAAALVEIRLLDHMVVGDGEIVSLAERGLI